MLVLSQQVLVPTSEGAEDIATPGDAGAEIGQEATPPDTVTGGTTALSTRGNN